MADDLSRPILVTGAPRSGTSLTTQILAACGTWCGDVNRLGENTDIRSRVVKHALKAAGLDPLGLRSFGDVFPNAEQLRGRVMSILRSQGYDAGPWVYKDAKLVFQWRAWAEAFPRARWVRVWRDPGDIAESLGRWSFSTRYALDWGDVVVEYHRRMDDIPGWDVRPGRFIAGDESEMKDVVESLGLTWRPGEVTRIADPSRWGGTKESTCLTA